MSDGVMKSISHKTEVWSFGLYFKIVYMALTFVQKIYESDEGNWGISREGMSSTV